MMCATPACVGTVMDIVIWLRSLGLGKYEAIFRENEIDETVLPDLTAADLKELGVTALGHRRKLLAAIAALRDDAGGKAPSVDAANRSSTPSTRPEDRAERRQVTVMFCDLVGSTALSARMDPEDLREVISAYQKCVAEAVQRFGGFVAKYMGDGVLVYFGYPQAHEDDAERAVRAALEFVAAVGDLKTHAALQTRVGIATGQVVVGDLIGSGEAQERGIVGETPNLAARLQGVAEPNSVVIAESTRKLLGNLFELEDLGAQDLKGMSGPLRAWGALRPSSVESRFEAMHAGALTELVGREEELELLLRRWAKAKTGEGQVVLLSGEPGIGKSRLTAALLERLAAEPHTRLRYFCSPQHSDSALYPIISQMERAAGFTHDDTPQAKLDKLDAVLTLSFTPRQDAALFAEMLSLPNDGRYPTLELIPQQRRQKTLEALSAQVEALSRANPVLMILEDAHWIDPTSLEAFGRTVDRLRTLGLLLIVTYRPEFEPPWIGQPHVTALTINRLGEREIAAMIDRVTGNKPLPESIRLDIIERTDGIPLFVEEMTKAVLEAESQGDAQQTAAAVPHSALSVPASLHASLMARLDRLGSAKDVAQIGAAIGREFSHPLLAAVVAKAETELQSALHRLIAAGLLFRQGVPPHATYLFKHALVQDAAYGTLLREPRRTLHARIAETLRDSFSTIADAEPEVVAHHFTQAALAEAGIEWWSKAGERALRTSAYEEAIAHLEKALALAGALAESPTQRLLRLRLQIAYGQALIHARGFASQETTAAFSRAREFASGIEEVTERFPVYYGLWASSWVRGELAQMREPAQAFLDDTKNRPGTREASIAHRLLGSTCWLQGDFIGARMHLENSLAIYNSERDRDFAFRFGQDSGVSAMIVLALTLWPLGEIKRASQYAEEAITQAARSAHVATEAFAHGFKSLFEMMRRDAGCASHQGEVLLGLAREHLMPQWLAIGTFTQGWALWHSGDRKAGEKEMRNGMALFREQGIRFPLPLCAVLLAEIEDELERIEHALAILDDALADAELTGQHHFDAELHRQRGALLLRNTPDDVAATEAAFLRAIEVARSQQTRTFELRAAMSMARLWRDQGKVPQARELLAPVYGWFTEGFDTHDLKEAKALLEELAA
jgi:class 3 adenylate cyclase/predicted ATPase